MSCDACDLAQQDLKCGRYNADCEECQARSIANGYAVFEATQEGKVTPRLKELLIRVYGSRWERGLELVQKWRQREKEQA